MSRLTEADRTQMTNALKRAVNKRQGWDLSPEWGALSRDEGGTGRVRARSFQVPEKMWSDYGHPAHFLDAMRSLIAAPKGAQQKHAAAELRAAVPPDMIGMYLVVEGWAPPVNRRPEIFESLQDGELRVPFGEMPGRVEARQGTAVDWDGTLYMIIQERTNMRLQTFTDTLSKPGVEVSGRLVELLLALLFALQPTPG